MISRRSSGSSRAASAVEPMRSQNITVSCRRSADGVGKGGTGPCREAGRICAAAMPRPAPQSPQNLAPGGFKLPQERQHTGIGAPHSVQKRRPSETSARQLGHSMDAPTPSEMLSLSQEPSLLLSLGNALERQEPTKDPPIVSVQNRYNVSDRSSEGVLAREREEGIAFLPRHSQDASSHGAVTGAVAVRERHNASWPQVAIALPLARFVT
jgi:hypothetical protein